MPAHRRSRAAEGLPRRAERRARAAEGRSHAAEGLSRRAERRARTARRRVAVVTTAATACTVLMLVLALPGGASGGGTGPAASPTPSGNVRISADGFMPDWIDGLTIAQDASGDRTCPWTTAYPVVPGAEALTTALATDVRDRVAVARGDGSGQDRFACIEPTNSTGLRIGFDFLIASRDVVGVRLTSHDVALDDRTTVQTYWYDGRTGKQSAPVALFSDSGLAALGERIAQILAGRPGNDESWARAALSPANRAEALSDVSFDGDGAVHVRFTRAQVQPVSVPPQEVVIPAAMVSGWLSAFGRRAQAQAVKPEPRLTLRTEPPVSRSAASGSAVSRSAVSGSPTAEPVPSPTAEPASSPTTEPVAPTRPVTPPDDPAVDCRTAKCIALTFDDGPGPFTAQLLADLQQYDARATFFVLGRQAVASPGLIRAEIDGGHEVGSHSWSHPELTRLTPAQVTRQLALADTALRAATGQAPTLVRPPYGALNATVKREAARPVILWNRDTLDWKYRNAQHVVDAVLGTARPGDIVLMHDIHPSTVEAVPKILAALAQQGYHFVTVSQLLRGVPLNAGQTYFARPGG